MTLTHKDIENLDNYWHNQLSETDRQAMENRLKTDAAFRRVAAEMRLITEGLEVVRLRKMKERLVDLEATLPEIDLDEKEKETPVRRLNSRWWAMAATGLVLVTAGIWFFNQNALARHEATEGGLKSVAKDYFEAYPAIGIHKGDDAATLKREALVKYAQKDYTHAIPILQKAFDMGKDSILLFYKGNAYLANGEAEAAIPLFEELQSASFVTRQSVNWYLALAYIEAKQKEKAVFLLKNLENTEGGYQAKAKALLEKL